MKKILTISEKNLLVLIIIGSVLARLLASIILGNQVTQMPGIADQVTYHTLAQRVMNGFGFTFDQPWWPATHPGDPTAHWSYIYTFYLVFVYKIFGVNALLARIIQAIVIGILQPLLLYKISKIIFPEISGLFSAGWIAIYPYLIYYSAALMTESWFTTVVLAVFWSAIRLKPTQTTTSYYLVLGVLSGTAILLRQVFMLFVPFLFLWILWNQRNSGLLKSIKNLVVSGLIIFIMILPFTIFNYQRFDRFVLLNTNAGFAFFWSNNPIYGTQFVGILPEEMGNYLMMLPVELKGLDEASLDSELLKRGLNFVFENPGTYALLSLSRIPILFDFLPSQDSSLLSNITRVTSFGFALPFMVFGIWLSIKSILKSKIIFFDSPISLILIFGFVYSAIHILTWSLVRYRLPIDALFLVFAGLALSKLSIFVRKRYANNQPA
ncbi:MAG: glycosyltransferase family 39 protein [Anaerolineaceae bacterium]